MTLQQRISSFSNLGAILGSITSASLLKAMEEAEKENAWFTRENILMTLSYWGEILNQQTIERWLDRYSPAIGKLTVPKRVGVIMAGNIPMVGFHDMLTVLISGHYLIAKLSSQDAWLIPALVKVLETIDPDWTDRIELTTGEIEKPDAIIATGSNNTSRYFSYYFAKYPHIIRKNRNGITILDGKESTTDLRGIASDIFSYFGLGCRNVSKLFLPEGYDFNPLHKALLQYQQIFHHPKYRNNLDYYKSIYMVNRTRFLDGVFYLLVKSEAIATPIGVLHYEYYSDLNLVESTLENQHEQIQCIVTRKDLFRQTQIKGIIEPGETQNPALWDYADGIDTMEFLLEKI